MDLGIDLTAMAKPGRRPGPVDATFVRELTGADLHAIANLPRGTEPIAVKRMTERHHALARMLASGLRDGEAAALVGYEQAWVSSIKKSPAFQELMDLYREQKDLEFAEFAGRMSGLGKDAINELQTRLETEPEKFTNGTLLELVKTLADRTGFGPQTTSVNVQVNLGDRLAAARARARAAMTDVTPPDDAVSGRDLSHIPEAKIG